MAYELAFLLLMTWFAFFLQSLWHEGGHVLGCRILGVPVRLVRVPLPTHIKHWRVAFPGPGRTYAQCGARQERMVAAFGPVADLLVAIAIVALSEVVDAPLVLTPLAFAAATGLANALSFPPPFHKKSLSDGQKLWGEHTPGPFQEGDPHARRPRGWKRDAYDFALALALVAFGAWIGVHLMVWFRR